MTTRQATSLSIFLSLVGLGLSGYLFFMHLGMLRGDLLGGGACGAGVFNCHVVTGSVWNTLFGLPLPIWGLIAYSGMLGLALLARQPGWQEDGLRLVALVAAVMVIADLFLLGIQAAILRNYCLLCLATYVVNAALWLTASAGVRQPAPAAAMAGLRALGRLVPSPQRPELGLFWGLLVLSAIGAIGLHLSTLFASRGTLGGFKQQIAEFMTGRPRVAVDVGDDPSIGPVEAPIQLVEFSDFFCPACQRASKMNHVLLENHRGQVRFVFKNFPLDQSCNTVIQRDVHPGACRAAAAGECAHAQGKFWPLHDRIFAKGHEYDLDRLSEDAREARLDVAGFNACLASGEGMAHVTKDIAEAGKASVVSTPTYLINGVPAGGGLTPETFQDFVDVLMEGR